MGNKPVKQRDEIFVKVAPPLDQAFVRWLARDLERIHGFPPRNPRAVKPPDHYIEFMRLYGWLDVSLDDPDLALISVNMKYGIKLYGVAKPLPKWDICNMGKKWTKNI
ncbi:hypothetical protein Csa_003696 [Cucumis sativus]|nr:hypothetical protein Csa_003696 [Cucumis sativus]